MRNASTNKLFLCFRPVVDIDVMLDSESSFSHASLAHKNSDTKSSSITPKRKLSRVIKAMVFETILNPRVRRKNRFRQDSCGSARSYSTNTEETSSTGDDKSICSQISVDASSIQEMIPESQPESKLLRKSESYPPEAKHRKRSPRDPLEKKRKKLKLDFFGIYFLLLSLTLTVFLGKILGSLLTSIGLYAYSFLKARYLRPKTESRKKSTRTGVKMEGYNKGHSI